MDAVSQVRGTRAAGATFYLPLGNGQVNGDFTVAGAPPAAPGKEHYANFRMITGDYFGALSFRSAAAGCSRPTTGPGRHTSPW